MSEIFRYDIAAWNDPRIILIDSLYGKRSEVPRLNYVVLPNYAPRSWPKYEMPVMS